MKMKTLVLLILAAAALGWLAHYTSRRAASEQTPPAGRKLLPDLPVNDVQQIVLESGTNRLVIGRAADRWTVPARFDYPANFERIRDGLRKLADLKVGPVVRLDRTQAAALQLSTDGSSTNVGTRLTLTGRDGRPLATLVLGKYHERKAEGPMAMYGGFPDGRYVAAGPEYYLVGETLDDFPLDARSWLDTEFVNVASSDITEVSVTRPGTNAIALARGAGGGELTLAGLAASEELDSFKANALASGLSFLSFSDVAGRDLPPERTGLATGAVYQAKTRDGRTYTVRIGSAPTGDTRRYASFEVAYAAPAPTPEPATTVSTNAAEAAAAEKQKADAERARKDAEQKTARQTQELAARITGWTYLIDSGKADAMLTGRGELVKPRETQPAGATNATPVAAASRPSQSAPLADE